MNIKEAQITTLEGVLKTPPFDKSLITNILARNYGTLNFLAALEQPLQSKIVDILARLLGNYVSENYSNKEITKHGIFGLIFEALMYP